MKALDVLRNSARSLFCHDVERKAINLKTRLEQAFLADGHGELAAYESASAWLERFMLVIREELSLWENLGLPSPVCVDESRSIAFGFGHDSYRYSVIDGLDAEYWSLVSVIETLGPREMLFCTTALLFAMGCTKIIVVDGPNDGGADVVGAVQQGRFSGLVVIAQSKSSTSSISKNTVRSELAKYRESQMAMDRYITGLSLGDLRSGTSCSYLISTNGLFEEAATSYALESRVLLRNRFQIAYALREIGITDATFQVGIKDISKTLARDLSRNLVPSLTELFRCE